MRRNNLDIECDILTTTLEGSLKTWIVYGANLNFNIVKKYLAGLIRKGCLELDGKLYFTTPKGKDYMDLIRACQGFH